MDFNFAEVHITKSEKGQKLINGLKSIKVIGEGSQGRIKLLSNPEENKFFAMKKFNCFLLKKKNKTLKNADGTVKYISLYEDCMRELRLIS